MNLKRIFLLLAAALLGLGAGLHAQTVDTVAIRSASMNKAIKNVVILPQGYDAKAAIPYPVVYLLHGFSGNYAQWIKTRPELPQDATAMRCIVVCPDGGYDSWYWDSPLVPEYRYETYISKELTEYIDAHYNTLKDRTGRAISGNSMGGHGALWVAFRHTDLFGACGAVHGGVDIRPFPDNWNMKRHLGQQRDNPQRWEEHTVINQLFRLQSGKGVPGTWGNAHLLKMEPHQLAIIFDCGTDDFFFDVNAALHQAMLYRGIVHDYTVRPGTHSGNYASNSLTFQLQFFENYFAREKKYREEAE